MHTKIQYFFVGLVSIVVIAFVLYLIRGSFMWSDLDISPYRGARVETCAYYGIWLRPVLPDVRVTLKKACMPI